jgi:hypothetical protein
VVWIGLIAVHLGHEGKRTRHRVDAEMHASALRRIHPPIRIGNREGPDQKHPVEHGLGPAVSTQGELVRNIAPRTSSNVWLGLSRMMVPSSGSWV